MDQRMMIVCSVVGSLGVLSAILGFSAEGTKLTITDVYVGYGACYYPQSPALGLGVCAAIFLIVAQITFAAVGGCCGCCKSRAIPSESNRIIGVICAVFSWISAIIAFGLLIDGAAWNATGTRDSSLYGYCYILKEGIFAGAAVLTLVATALGLTSYIMLRKQPASAAAGTVPKAGEQMQAGIAMAMGQPQFPQQASPQGQGYGQAPPSYPQYSPPPQGQGQGYGQAPSPHYPPPPAQGYAPNQQQQQQFPHPPGQGYGAQPPNQQYPPPAHGYGAQAPNQQFPPASPPPAAQGYGPHTPPNGHEQA